jgi:hypothetical protein
MNASRNTSSDIGSPTYKELGDPDNFSGTTISTGSIAAGATTTVASFATNTGSPGTTVITSGVYAAYLHFQSNGNSTWEFSVQYYSYTTGGTETLLFTSAVTPAIADAAIQMYISDAYFSGVTAVDVSTRLVTKIIAKNTSSNAHTLTFYTEGGANYSYITTPLALTNGTSGTSGSSGSSGTSWFIRN